MYNYECQNCKIKFETYYKKVSKSGLTFCSKKCSGIFKKNSSPKLFLTCQYCKKVKETDTKFKAENRKFCSYDCYWKYKQENPELFLSKKFIEEGRKAANSPKAIEKGLKTKHKNGTVVDWKDNKDWKRYWKEVNRLTRLKRKEMLEDWDGYDYYTGVYIKDFLSLPYHHKNYPTLDHIKPRSQGFKEGLTPKEITVKENLVWTTRSNNSKKGSNKI